MMPIVTHQIPVAGATLFAEQIQPHAHAPLRMQLQHGSSRWPLNPRAKAALAQATGLRLGRMEAIAKTGMELSRYLIGPNEQHLWISTHEQQNTAIAVSTSKPTPIAVNDVVDYANSRGYTFDVRNSTDGRMRFQRLDDKEFYIAGDRYRSGTNVDFDAAGHDLPSANVYLERQICLNGQVIQIAHEERLVPQYGADGGLNAGMLVDHLEAWSGAGLPEPIQLRLAKAAGTAASYAEVIGLHQIIKSPEIVGLRRSRFRSQRSINTIADHAIDRMLGDWRARTGVAAIGEIPRRDLRFLPSETTVAGLINLATEVATHYVDRAGGNTAFQRWWNRMIQRRYDLEGVADRSMTLPARWISEPAQTAMMSTNPSAN